MKRYNIMQGISFSMLYLFILLIVPFVSCDKIVVTNSGPVRGVTLDAKKVEAFLGIPYAEPPVGPLRFAKPVPKAPWTETYDAKKFSSVCVQAVMKLFELFFGESLYGSLSEDCLYLNIWVPEGGSDRKTIMLFIHGGAFMAGSANMRVYDGAQLAQRGDVIVVTINYRVGTLGFFSSFTDDIPGSMGMLDQIMAIQWIKDNAKHFGGDPDNIVLFGESAGGWSISLLMVSPLSRNLFNRVILMSGAIGSMISEGNEALYMGSQFIANHLGCADSAEALKENPKGIVECMKNLPAEKFSETDAVFMKNSGILFPKVGGDFLPKTPIDLFREGVFEDADMLIGITKDEGTLFTASMKFEEVGLFGEKLDASTFNETYATELVKGFTRDDQLKEILENYVKRAREESRYSYISAVSDMLGDFLITCGAIFQAEYHSLKNYPVYFYMFNFKPKTSPFAEWMGVPHFSEVPYMFGNALFAPFTEYEEEFSGDMMDMWIAFAKTGVPNIPGGLKWPRFSFEDPKYLTISQRDSVGVRPDNYRCESWRTFFRSVIDQEVIANLKASKD